jgi:hypothetical protein
MSIIDNIHRLLLPFVAFGLSASLVVAFAFGVHTFRMLQIDSTASTTYAGLVMFLVGGLVVLCLTVYCGVVFDGIHRVFLRAVATVYCAGLAILAVGLPTFKDTVVAYVEQLWNTNDGPKTMVLEDLFECRGFHEDVVAFNDTSGCASAIGEWVGARTKSLSAAFGAMFGAFLIAGIATCILACKRSRSAGDGSGGLGDMKREIQRDIEQNLTDRPIDDLPL